jgi:preprotein translocase subunit SecB
MSEQQPIFGIEKIFLKDLSLEIPGAPQIFAEQEAPKIDINLHNETREIDSGIYEVVLTATVTAKVKDDKTAFLVEVAQAGIFQIRNVPSPDLEALLGITCANVLFPYLRESVSSVVVRGGFPPFFLNHLNFEALYQQRLQQQQQQAAGAASRQA